MEIHGGHGGITEYQQAAVMVVIFRLGEPNINRE
jgi:hypothetical protein